MSSSTTPRRGHLPQARPPLKPRTKIGLVVGGYAISAVVASLAVAGHLMAIGGPARQAYSGMNAFGDCLLFLAVFGVAAVPATGLGLYFLRPYPAFWRLLAWVAFGVALTGPAALGTMVADPLSTAAGVVFPRVLVAPGCALLGGLAGLFAPVRSSRIALLAAAAVEVATFVGWVGWCFVRNA